MHYNFSPPLEEEDIPMGDWICLKCYHKEQLRLAAANANYNSNIVGIKKPSITQEEKDDKEVRTCLLCFPFWIIHDEEW